MTTRNASLSGGWKPSRLMVRILSAFVILALVIGLVLAGLWGVYVLVLLIGGAPEGWSVPIPASNIGSKRTLQGSCP